MIQYINISHFDPNRYLPRQQISFGRKNANSCAILEDVPEGKEGETNEEAKRATLILNINSCTKFDMFQYLKSLSD